MQPDALAQAKSLVADELSPCLSGSSFLRPYSSPPMRHNAPCVSTRMLTIGTPLTPERKNLAKVTTSCGLESSQIVAHCLQA